MDEELSEGMSLKIVSLNFVKKERKKKLKTFQCTIYLRSNYPYYVVTYYIKWVTTSWTDSICFFIVMNEVLGDPEVSANLYCNSCTSVL